jgi:hypothetical protein
MRIHRTTADNLKAVAVDGAGNIFLLATHRDTSVNHGDQLAPGYSTSITKLDVEGRIVWSRTWPLLFADSAIAVAPSGFFYFAGRPLRVEADFGLGPIRRGEAVLARFDTAGEPVWQIVRGYPRTGMNQLTANDLFVSVRTYTNAPGYLHVGLDLVSADGAIVWSRHVGTDPLISGGPYFLGTALADDGSMYVAGDVFGPASVDGVSIAAPDIYHSPFVAKFAPTGVIEWAIVPKRESGQVGGGFSQPVLVPDGSLLFYGYFNGEGQVRFGQELIDVAAPIQSSRHVAMLGRVSSDGQPLSGTLIERYGELGYAAGRVLLSVQNIASPDDGSACLSSRLARVTESGSMETLFDPMNCEESPDGTVRISYAPLDSERIVVAGAFRGEIRFGDVRLNTVPGEETDIYVGVLEMRDAE